MAEQATLKVRRCALHIPAAKRSTTETAVVKAPPDLIPKGKRGQQHGGKSTVREKLLSQNAVQLGRIW